MVNMHLGYIVPLEGMQFTETADGEYVSTFQAFPFGTYHHSLYGKIEYDEKKCDEMVSNVAAKVRGQDLDIDYDHKAHSGEAAGWIRAAEKRSDGLWLTVGWTKKAYEKIKEKSYKYFSPEFDWKWKHPQTQTVHQNVLFGGGITNRPFLKGILPINLSEFEDGLGDDNKEETQMDPKKLRKLLGLPEDATDEQVTEAMNKVPDDHVIGEPPKTETAEEKAAREKVEAEKGAGGTEDEVQPIAASDASIAEVIKLAETSTDPAVKALAELVGGLSQTLKAQGSALALAEAQATVLKLSQPTDGKMLSAGAGKLLSDAILNPTPENVMAFAEGVVKGGVVPAGESVSAAHEGEAGKDAVKKFDEAVEKKIAASEGKLNYNSAAEIVAQDNPQLYAEMRAGSYSLMEA